MTTEPDGVFGKMKIISYKFRNPKAYLECFTILKVIDAESPVVIFVGTIGILKRQNLLQHYFVPPSNIVQNIAILLHVELDTKAVIILVCSCSLVIFAPLQSITKA